MFFAFSFYRQIPSASAASASVSASERFDICYTPIVIRCHDVTSTC